MSIDVTLTSYILNPWTNSGSTPIGYHGGTSNLIALSYANLDFTPSASDPYKSTSGDVFKVYVNGTRIYRQSDQDYAGGSGFLEDGDTSGQTLNGVSAAWTATNNTVWEINTALQLILLNVDGTTGVASTTLYGSGGLNVSFATSSSAPIIELRRAVQDLKTPAIDFSNASILTEQDLDNSAKNVFHVSQQAVISTENAMMFDSGTDTYKATQPGTSNTKRISNVSSPSAGTDAANKSYVDGSSNTVTVANNIANVNHVAGQISPTNNISTVAGSVTAGHIATVAGDATDIGKVAGKETEIGRLGSSAYADGANAYLAKLGVDAFSNASSGYIKKVADIDANVTKVANIDSNVTTVATLGTNGANVTTVAGKSTEIDVLVNKFDGSTSSTSGTNRNITQVDTVADAIANVNTVAAANSNITTITTGDNLTNIETCADNIGSLNTVATNAESNAIVMGIALG